MGAAQVEVTGGCAMWLHWVGRAHLAENAVEMLLVRCVGMYVGASDT